MNCLPNWGNFSTRKQWANVGHTPKPDAERYYIWVPLMVKRPKKDSADGELEEIFIGRYKPVWCMYPLSQTEGEPLPPKPTNGRGNGPSA